MDILLFGQLVDFPHENKGFLERGRNARQYWNCVWMLQIHKDNHLWNDRVVQKLQNRNEITLSSVCQWVASYDGILKSVTTENYCLKFSIRIFSKRNYEKFRHLLVENQLERDLEPILLDKEVLEHNSRSRYHMKILHRRSSYTVITKEADGYESDDSALSSNPDLENLAQVAMPDEWFNNFTRRVDEMQTEIREFKQNFIEALNENFKAISEKLYGQIREVHRKMERLNEDVKSSDAQTEKMSSGRFQHVFQKIELLRRQQEQTFSKVAQLESTTTESNALVFELHQKVDSLRRTVQQHSGDIENKSSECSRIKELLAMIIKSLEMDCSLKCKLSPQGLSREQLTVKSEEIFLNVRQSDQVNCNASRDSNDSENIESHSSMSTEDTNGIPDKKSTLTFKGEMDDLSSCEFNDTIYPFYSEEHVIKQVPTDISPESNRPLSPTLAKAISEYGSELLISDDGEETELLEDITTESASSEEPADTESYQNIITETNRSDQQYVMMKYCTHSNRTLNLSDHKNSKLVRRTTEKVPEDCKEELNLSKINPSYTENTCISDDRIQINNEIDHNNADVEVSNSECDTDIEETLKVSGLTKSKPVIRTVKEALKVDHEESRLHGLDTMLCVDVSGSMTSKVMEQVKSSIFSFLDVVEEIAIDDGLEENIGLTVFGKETKILVQLTNDYTKFRRAIESLTVGGTSPIHTALSLCRLELQRNGHATCIHEHCIAPRIILFTDGRVTRDSYMDMSESEHAPKDPEKYEEITTFVQQLGTEGFQLFTVGTGRQTNKEFLERLANLGGGKYFDLDNISVLTKHFKYQFIVGEVIHRCRETSIGYLNMDYKTQLQQIIGNQTCKIDQEDIVQIEEFLLSSEELTDVEYPGLPKLGSRVKTNTGEVGTVVKHRKLNWIKIKLDSGDIIYRHFIQNAQNNELATIDDPRKAKDEFDFCVGAMVVGGDPTNNRKGFIYDKLNLGFVKVKWQDGLREILKIHDLRLIRNGSRTERCDF
ncbi:uncharacterized protein LOC133182673 [Saccostrea echinata]|uniref:uncharacterized protein LOC133182673 n=1 Tax=Saccostrea echinata TaxID=191078 RepID=UPI002A808DE4|nr:uncharacterized protein LOC133182673 [Saccostrea echinata]